LKTDSLALKDLQKPDEAALLFRASLKLDPNNPRVYNNLGSVYMTLRRIEDAIKCFGQALVIQPSFAEVKLQQALKGQRN
jgi:tetratricopeptide (TPR) repeat protein